MMRSSNHLCDDPLEDLPLADSLQRFAEKEKQRRARLIVERRAKQLNELRELVLRRRAEKGQPMDALDERAVEAGIHGRDDWECATGTGGHVMASITAGLGKSNGNEQPVVGDVGGCDKADSRKGTARTIGSKKGNRKTRTHGTKAQLLRKKRRENSLKRRGQGLTGIPRDFSPLADIPEKELARVYAEPNYPSRLRLYKDAARRACGLKVWTWDDLVNGEPRALQETCRVPTSDIKEEVLPTGKIFHTTSSRNVKGQPYSASRKFAIPSKVTRDSLRAIYQEIQDEKREQELKFLELEMKMTPYVVQAGLFDSDPEFTETLRDTILSAKVRQQAFEASQQRRATLPPPAPRPSHGASWNPVPCATRLRAQRRAELEARRRERLKALEYDPEEEDDIMSINVRDMLCFDPNTKTFMPPQALLLRAKEREQYLKDRVRWRERRRRQMAERKQREGTKQGKLCAVRNSGRRSGTSKRASKGYGRKRHTSRALSPEIPEPPIEEYGYTSSDTDKSTVSCSVRARIKSPGSKPSPDRNIPINRAAYYKRKAGYTSSSSSSVSPARRSTRSCSNGAGKRSSSRRSPFRSQLSTGAAARAPSASLVPTFLSLAKKILARDTCSETEVSGADVPRRCGSHCSSSSGDETRSRANSTPRSNIGCNLPKISLPPITQPTREKEPLIYRINSVERHRPTSSQIHKISLPPIG